MRSDSNQFVNAALGLYDAANLQIAGTRDSIDKANPQTYVVWGRFPLDSAWVKGNLAPGGILAPGC